MSTDPSTALSEYVEAWQHSVDSLNALCASMEDVDWMRRTECPGWTVRDHVSHIIAIECELLGDPRPIHTLPRDLFHVVDEFSRYMEVPVDYRRCHTPPEMVAELDYTLIRRRRQIDNSKLGPDDELRGVMGKTTPYRELLRDRAFEVWIHEQDVRRAVNAAGDLDGPGADVAQDVLTAALPDAVAEAELSTGSSVMFDIDGPTAFSYTVRIGPGGLATGTEGAVVVEPTVRVATDWETFVRLACGRVRPSSAKVTVEGDPTLGEAVMTHMVVTD